MRWSWTYVDRATGLIRRHQLLETVVQRDIAAAVRRSILGKRATPHSLRHSFATHLLADGYGIHTIQTLLGHRDVRTTRIHTHLLGRGPLGVRSPLEELPPAGDGFLDGPTRCSADRQNTSRGVGGLGAGVGCLRNAVVHERCEFRNAPRQTFRNSQLTMQSRDRNERTPLKAELKWFVATVVGWLLLVVGGFVWLLHRYLGL